MDALGRLLSITDGNGNQTRWQYQNERERLITVFWPDNTESRLAYDDSLGRLIKEISPLHQITEYRYDFKTTLRPTIRIGCQSKDAVSFSGTNVGNYCAILIAQANNIFGVMMTKAVVSQTNALVGSHRVPVQ